jgi:hypothetical protein
MKVIIETIITLVENDQLNSTLTRATKLAENKVKDEYVSFVLDTEEIFGIAKSGGLEDANNALDKVLNKYSGEIKSKLSKTINN